MAPRPGRCLLALAAGILAVRAEEAGAALGEPAAPPRSCAPWPELPRGEFHRAQFPVGGQNRSVLVYVPSSLPADGSRSPAVLVFHGFHSNPWYVGRLIDIRHYAERYSLVVGLPFGTSPTFSSELCCPVGCDEACCSAGDQLDPLRPCMWNAGGATEYLPRVGSADDVGMARAVVDFLVRSACVDAARVSAVGFSMGGMMMHRLACEAPEVFNGIASISGSMAVEECNPSRPTAWLHFCGSADAGCSRSVNRTFERFGASHGCRSEPQRTYVSATTRCEARLDCDRGTFVEKCLVAGLGDEVPGHQRQVPAFVPQPATNIDAIKYALDRFSTQRAAPVESAQKAQKAAVEQPQEPLQV